MRVLVVGAGLGGLTLAHGLARGGLDVRVLERAGAPTGQPSSYGIHLDADGLRSLHGCLPPAAWDRVDAAASPAPPRVRFWNPALDLLADVGIAAPETLDDPITRRRSVGRDALHAALLEDCADGGVEPAGNGPVVCWDRRFAGYDDLPDGSVRVRCTDGTRLTADLLVGADGANSAVRAQRRPGLERVDLAIDIVAGRTDLTPELAGTLPAALVDGGVNNVVPAGPGWLFTSTWPGDPARAAGTAGPVLASVVWAWVADRGSYAAAVETLTPTQLRDVVARGVRRWSPALRELVARTDPATVAPVRLRTMPPLQPWEPTNVTLLGDAVHTMTPMAGIGANTAIRDADALRRALTADGPQDLRARVGHYETEMRAYANEALALSTRNARNAASTRRLPRLAFRTVLRVAETVPAVKRTVFGRQSAA